jgi:hypothetical protein
MPRSRPQGYDGGYSRVTDFIRAWRQGEGQAVHQRLRAAELRAGRGVPVRLERGRLVVGGIYYKVQVAHMKLCASRAFWLVAYPSQGHEMLFDAHTGRLPRWAAWPGAASTTT